MTSSYFAYNEDGTRYQLWIGRTNWGISLIGRDNITIKDVPIEELSQEQLCMLITQMIPVIKWANDRPIP